VAASGATWGFSAVEFIDSAGAEVDTLREPKAYTLAGAISAIPFARSIGFAILALNVLVSTGNLFCSRALWETLGGFRNLRYNHDWDFALRALWQDEPVFVRRPLYRYRLHSDNTIDESVTKAREEARAPLSDYLALATGNERPPNEYAPSLHGWGADFAVAVLQGGLAEVLDVPGLHRLVELVEARASRGSALETT
jgi:hypothetical protein